MVDDDVVELNADEGAEWLAQLGKFLSEHPEPKAYEKRHVEVTPEMLDAADIADILEPAFNATAESETLDDHDRAMVGLSHGQRLMFAIYWYQAEVNNGGHDQFYSNSYGMVWQDALEGLEAIGAPETKQILLESVKRFAEPPARDRQIRANQQEGLSFDDLDAKFYLTSEDLDELMREYILAHPQQFLFSGDLVYTRKTHKCQYIGNGVFKWVPIRADE